MGELNIDFWTSLSLVINPATAVLGIAFFWRTTIRGNVEAWRFWGIWIPRYVAINLWFGFLPSTMQWLITSDLYYSAQSSFGTTPGPLALFFVAGMVYIALLPILYSILRYWPELWMVHTASVTNSARENPREVKENTTTGRLCMSAVHRLMHKTIFK